MYTQQDATTLGWAMRGPCVDKMTHFGQRVIGAESENQRLWVMEVEVRGRASFDTHQLSYYLFQHKIDEELLMVATVVIEGDLPTV